MVLGNPLAYDSIETFKSEVERYKKDGYKILVDMHHWMDIPDITKRTLLILLKVHKVDGVIISEAGGSDVKIAVETIEGLEIFYRSWTIRNPPFNQQDK